MLETVDFVESPGTLPCRFPVRLDTSTCQALEGSVRDRIATTPHAVVFDLTGVDYVSSAFLRLCQIVYKQVEGERFRISNASPLVTRVFKIAGFDKLVPIT